MVKVTIFSLFVKITVPWIIAIVMLGFGGTILDYLGHHQNRVWILLAYSSSISKWISEINLIFPFRRLKHGIVGLLICCRQALDGNNVDYISDFSVTIYFSILNSDL